jgi:hypothetical protein
MLPPTHAAFRKVHEAVTAKDGPAATKVLDPLVGQLDGLQKVLAGSHAEQMISSVRSHVDGVREAVRAGRMDEAQQATQYLQMMTQMLDLAVNWFEGPAARSSPPPQAPVQERQVQQSGQGSR